MIHPDPALTGSLSLLDQKRGGSQERNDESAPDQRLANEDVSGSAQRGEPSSDSDDEGMESDTDRAYQLPLDQIFEILKNSRRRQTIRYLIENGDETTLSDLAEEIAALENGTTVKAISSSQRKRVYVGLYQCHLPKMDDTDIVDYDQNRGTIKLGPNADQLIPYLDESEPKPWHMLYAAVALGGLALFVVSQVGGAAFGLNATVVLVLLLGGMGASIATHYLSTAE